MKIKNIRWRLRRQTLLYCLTIIVFNSTIAFPRIRLKQKERKVSSSDMSTCRHVGCREDTIQDTENEAALVPCSIYRYGVFELVTSTLNCVLFRIFLLCFS
jgi:hypothetical protein